MKQNSLKLNYTPELDGLRGVAILAVMIFHTGAPILRGGFIGVDIFFVLSGFLITSLLIQEFDNSGSTNLKNFYMRRILRLFPALIALLIVFCLVSFATLSKEQANRNYIDALISLVYLSNFAQILSIDTHSFIEHTWSLSIEEQFYIIWPIILLAMLRLFKKRHHVVIIAIAVALLAWIFRIYLTMNDAPIKRLLYGLDTRADSLMVGCIIGILLSSKLISKNKMGIIQKFLVVAAPLSMVFLLAISIFGNGYDPRMHYWGFLVVELLTGVLILDISMSPRSIVKKLLATRWLVWVGSISYGLYLWHYPIIQTMNALELYGWSVLIVGSLITFMVATLSYYVIEKPILKLKKHFTHATPNM